MGRLFEGIAKAILTLKPSVFELKKVARLHPARWATHQMLDEFSTLCTHF
jgi:hypothetical protein